MADKEKVKKKKVKKEEAAAPEEAAPPPPPEPEPVPEPPPPARSSTKKKSSRKTPKRSGSNVFSMFTTTQVAEFKEGFSMMDKDQDGILGKEDLRATWDMVGKLITDGELDAQLEEAPGPINFTQLLFLFANRMTEGGADDAETVRIAFMSFDEDGKIDTKKLKPLLLGGGDKFTPKEVAEIYDAMDIDKNGMIETEDIINMLTSGGDDD